MASIRQLWKNNGLSITLAALFLLFLSGQIISGWWHYNDELSSHGRSEVSLPVYLQTGAFGEAVFENWESEFLQMGLYVVLTVFLFQKGSSESKDPDKMEEVDLEPPSSQADHLAPLPVRRGGWMLSIYRYSLSLAFFTLFILSFCGHAIFGLRAYNEDALFHGQPTATLFDYLGSSQFWFESFQNWQSEFLAIYSIVILSIWLRQKGSPESKPIAHPHSSTG